MSINLAFSFDRHRLSGPLLCHERLSLSHQDYELFDRIKADAVPMTEGVQWYGDEGIEDEKTDPYDAPLTWMPAHTLSRHLKDAPLTGYDAAVRAFIAALPPDTKVVLWWH